jgi:hypothetical protein
MLLKILGAAAVSLLAGCATYVPPGTEHRTITIGEDSYTWEGKLTNVTRAEIASPPTIVTDKKGRVTHVIPDPMAGILKADTVEIRATTRNQSNAFAKAMGSLNNLIMGWTAVEGLKAATAQRQSDNALRTAQAREATKQQELLTAPTKYLPAEGEAISRAGSTPFIP